MWVSAFVMAFLIVINRDNIFKYDPEVKQSRIDWFNLFGSFVIWFILVGVFSFM